MQNHWIIQYSPENGQPSRWLSFHQPVHIFTVHQVADVLPALTEIERGLGQGHTVAGFLAYEAAPAFERAMAAHPQAPLPLLHLGLFREIREHKDFPLSASGPHALADWQPAVSAAEHAGAIERIKQWIANGDTYQVNYTLRMRSQFQGDPVGWFWHLLKAQRPRYAAYLETDDDTLLSASPELFWSLQGDRLFTRPMKGTSRRGRYAAEDEAMARTLQHSAKNRAENLMILDMMRNDLGRIAQTGSVAVPSLFDVERYPTLWQMTSTVSARTQAGLCDIMGALFPSCSITGAPKLRTMEIIRQLEPAPRGIYTGTIGFMAPNRTAQWNVAIRTAHLHRPHGTVEYGTGGGIVWDSDSAQEYRECATKALILTRPTPPDFDLLETMRWHPRRGYWLLSEHLQRLSESATYFGYAYDAAFIQQHLDRFAATRPTTPRRVRLLLSRDGGVRLESQPVALAKGVWTVAIDSEPVQAEDLFLHHKTTYRPAYDRALARHPNRDDVLLWNQAGELTESCFGNLLLRREQQWLTPPLTCGLLDGVLRRSLLRRGRIREAVLTQQDLATAERVVLINSVRGWIPICLAGTANPCAF